MSNLSSYRLLTFDVYGTLVDWEGGILAALEPSLAKNNASGKFTRQQLLTAYHEFEKAQQTETPDMLYTDVLATILAPLLSKLGLQAPTADESRAFGESVGKWPAFPDTVAALKRLQKVYKLVVLSNVDRESFSKTNAGSLEGFKFDLVITAQDVGSYKPDLRNFSYMLDAVKREFGVEREQVLQTARANSMTIIRLRSRGLSQCGLLDRERRWGIWRRISLIGSSILWGRWRMLWRRRSSESGYTVLE